MNSAELERIIELRRKYPQRLPVIIHQSEKDILKKRLKKVKYLVNGENTIGILLWHIKRTNDISGTEGCYLLYENTLLHTSSTLNSVYAMAKPNVLLNLTFCYENVFGK